MRGKREREPIDVIGQVCLGWIMSLGAKDEDGKSATRIKED